MGMKSTLFKWITAFVVGVSVWSCGLIWKAQKPADTQMGTPALFGETVMYNARQVDSMCFVDGISNDLDNWLSSQFVDFETNSPVTRYAFIKVISDNEEMTYILTPVDTLYQVTKRYIKEVEEDEE